jgi:hypothetical protein
VRVRRLQPALLASRLKAPEAIELPDGRTVLGATGDWRVYRGTTTLDLVPPTRFPKDYELIPEVGLTLSPSDCTRLEQTTGLGTTQIPITFISAVEQLASLSIGDVRLEFTPGQLAELHHRASKRGRSIELEIKAVVDRIRDEIFHKGG